MSIEDKLVEENGPTIRTDKLAEYLHCHPSHVRAMCAEGKMPGAFKLGKRWFVSTIKFAELLEGGGADGE